MCIGSCWKGAEYCFKDSSNCFKKLGISDIATDDYINFDIEVMTTDGKLTNKVNEETDEEEEDPNNCGPINIPRIARKSKRGYKSS